MTSFEHEDVSSLRLFAVVIPTRCIFERSAARPARVDARVVEEGVDEARNRCQNYQHQQDVQTEHARVQVIQLCVLVHPSARANPEILFKNLIKQLNFQHKFLAFLQGFLQLSSLASYSAIHKVF